MILQVPSLCCSAHVRYIPVSLPRIDRRHAGQVCVAADHQRHRCAVGADGAMPRPGTSKKAVGLTDRGQSRRSGANSPTKLDRLLAQD